MTFNKLVSLRKVMKSKQLAAIIIPTSDPHKSEYIADYYKTRQWLTGFTGSAGTAVITLKHAGVWTDSRYFIQAEKELDNGIILHKLKTRTPEYEDWLIDQLQFGDIIGIDAKLFSYEEIKTFKSKLKAKQIRIVPIGDVFSEFWHDRPTLPKAKAFLHDLNYAGESRGSKIERVRSYLEEKNIVQMLVTALDEVAWLLNIRGADIDFNPVVASFCYVSKQQVVLFIDENKIDDDVALALKKDKISIQPYQNIHTFLSTLTEYSTLLTDKVTFNYHLSLAVPTNCKILSESSIVSKFKAIKNSTEILNYKNAQIRDGLAVCNFLHWLDQTVEKETISEYDAAIQIEKFRSLQDNYIGESFAPISAYQQNAALPHYACSKENASQLKPQGLYLIDSGGQYLDGTTDITRTVAVGEVANEQITDYTLVLKGHIRLSKAVFKKGTKGFQLDTLARLDLWQQGKDFGHGTGHGIGFFLNVHEGPQGFSQATAGPAQTEFKPGMLTTNEPGIYLEGKYGIRIENVLLCVNFAENEMGEFYGFETLTYCPYDKKLIDKELLTSEEIQWINNYHRQVYELVSEKASTEILPWLKAKTSPL